MSEGRKKLFGVSILILPRVANFSDPKLNR